MINPDLADAILRKVTEYFEAYWEALLSKCEGRIDVVMTADDIGHQEGLLMDIGLWRERIRPYHERINRLIHRYGAKVLYHSDGAIMDAVPDLIDMGVDALEALQFDAKNMDAKKLKELYGDRVAFHGGISVQRTLPFGSVADVEKEIQERIAVLGKGGGYILAPSHAIQAGTPVENVLTLLRHSANWNVV